MVKRVYVILMARSSATYERLPHAIRREARRYLYEHARLIVRELGTEGARRWVRTWRVTPLNDQDPETGRWLSKDMGQG
jgi:hypothetical protein